MKSRDQLFHDLDDLLEKYPTGGVFRWWYVGEETYGDDAMVYVTGGQSMKRKDLEAALRQLGHTVHDEYDPRGSTIEVQVERRVRKLYRMGIVTNVGRPESPNGDLIFEIGAIAGSGCVVERDGFRFEFGDDSRAGRRRDTYPSVSVNWGMRKPLSPELCRFHGLDAGIDFSS